MPLILPRFQRLIELVEENRTPTQAHHQWWDKFAKNLEDNFNNLEQTVLDLQTVIKNDKISASTTDPSVVVSASDNATIDATITIAAHTRRYGDGTTLAVSGGAVTGLAYTTLYAIYYDDTTLLDTTPTYVATTVLKDAQPNAVLGRHYVDQITTPASGGGGTSGGGGRPPGGGGPYP